MNDFNETTKFIEGALNSNDIYYVFRGPQVDELRQAYGIMKDHISRAMSDMQVYVSMDATRLVNNTLTHLQRAIAVAMVPDSIKRFMLLYTTMVFNWNKIAHSEEIATGVQATKNMLDYQNSLLESIGVLRAIVHELKGIAEYRPIAHDISRHYQQAIYNKLKEMDAKEDVSNENQDRQCGVQSNQHRCDA